MAAFKMSCQNPASSDLPGRPNATIRSPAVARTVNQGSGARHGRLRRHQRVDLPVSICFDWRNGNAATIWLRRGLQVSLPSSIG
jgi:hypothetical protein